MRDKFDQWPAAGQCPRCLGCGRGRETKVSDRTCLFARDDWMLQVTISVSGMCSKRSMR